MHPPVLTCHRWDFTETLADIDPASWYGPPYNKRRGANGEIFDQDAFTAANRTLPLNSLVEVTNLRTGRQAIMRITDRGPFVPDRVLDVYLLGLAPSAFAPSTTTRTAS